MTFRQLAFSNIRGSSLRYAAFFLSSVFSVTLFYVYAQFLLHPEVIDGAIYGGEASRVVLTVCEVLVVAFSFMFVLYSSGAFLRARNKEFGLLTLMGTTRAQLRRLIWLENSLISVLAIGTGVLLGILFSRLFLLAISRVLLLDAPISFALVPGAIWLTAGAFLLLFQLVTFVNGLFLGRRSVAFMLGAAKRPLDTPRASILLAAVGLLLVLTGYVVAIMAKGMVVVAAFVPVVAVVVTGTYLLFTHGSVHFLRLLQRNERTYLRGTRMLVVSQLLFRVRDNARLLATIASLSAVVLTAAGTFHVFNQQLGASTAQMHPQALALYEPAAKSSPHLTAAEVDALLAEQGVIPRLRTNIPLLQLKYRDALSGREGWLELVEEEAYAALVAQLGLEAPTPGDAISLSVRDGVAVLNGEGGGLAARPEQAQDPEAGEPQLGFTTSTALMTLPLDVRGTWYLVPGAQLRTLLLQNPELVAGELWLYDWKAGRNENSLTAALRDAVAERPGSDYRFTSVNLQSAAVRQAFGLSLFAGVFVSLLFFIGAGSLIYFKLFTELPDDSRLLLRLRRIGITPGEMRRIITAQIGVIFFLPFALGGLHATIALGALGNMLMVEVAQYTAVVLALFALVQFGFFLLTRWTYLRQVRRLINA